jgi:antirestriction protein ArdC
MTNTEIIIKEAILSGLYTPEEAEAIMQTYGALPLHTFAAWKAMGYTVKKGEHAALIAYLWKYTTKQNKENGENETKVIRTKAFLFKPEQVQKIKTI